ncbi:MAG TPA: trypsin-like peptidase domain-containing protein [Pseudonocardiaceae bacterium]|nr:trypsin-like peptidase domain-containing protein [Pseudonocardiaceae bacterium]
MSEVDRPGGYWPPQVPPPPRRHPLRLVVVLIVAAMLSAVALGVGRAAWQAAFTVPLVSSLRVPSGVSAPWAPSTVSPPASQPGGSADVSALVAKVAPGLVDINTQLGYQNGEGAGTGIVLSPSGEVLTNNHVISGATNITVTDIGNGQTYPATVVGYDRNHDVAVLQMQGASGLQTATIGDSNAVAVGDVIAAIGNAGGVGGTPSIAAGTVSALDQAITVSDDTTGSSEQLDGLIQVAANVAPGDSGGPLVNTAGQVVGVDTAGAGGSRFEPSTSEGMAIPINDAIAISKQIDSGASSANVHIGPTGILGIMVREATSQAEYGRSGSRYGSVPGVLVAGVTPGSPSEQSGLAAGDVIVSLDGAAVDSPTALTSLLTGHHPGDLVRVAWADQSGQQQNAGVRLATGPPS